MIFKHRLALALGCFVRDINERMDADELAGWREYSTIEPFGFPREEARFGTIAANIMAIAPFKMKDSRVRDPNWWRYRLVKPMTDKQAIANMQGQFPGARKKRRVAII